MSTTAELELSAHLAPVAAADNDIETHTYLSDTDPVLWLLSTVRDHAAMDGGVPYAGSVSPQDAWLLLATGSAVIVDVRTAEERKFVGYVPGTLHVPWMTGTALVRNPRFVRELELKIKKDHIVLLLCRSGKRSAQAAEAATKAGFSNVFNIRHGFEGDLDEDSRRGASNGWRYQNLPWQQD